VARELDVESERREDMSMASEKEGKGRGRSKGRGSRKRKKKVDGQKDGERREKNGGWWESGRGGKGGMNSGKGKGCEWWRGRQRMEVEK